MITDNKFCERQYDCIDNVDATFKFAATDVIISLIHYNNYTIINNNNNNNNSIIEYLNQSNSTVFKLNSFNISILHAKAGVKVGVNSDICTRASDSIIITTTVNFISNIAIANNNDNNSNNDIVVCIVNGRTTCTYNCDDINVLDNILEVMVCSIATEKILSLSQNRSGVMI